MHRASETHNTERTKTLEINTNRTKKIINRYQSDLDKKLSLDLKAVNLPNQHQILSDRPKNQGSLVLPYSHSTKGSISRVKDPPTRTNHSNSQNHNLNSPKFSLYLHAPNNYPNPYLKNASSASRYVKVKKLSELSVQHSPSETPYCSQQQVVHTDFLAKKEHNEKEFLQYIQERQRQKLIQERILKNLVSPVQGSKTSSNEDIPSPLENNPLLKSQAKKNKLIIATKKTDISGPISHYVSPLNQQYRGLKLQTPSDVSNTEEKNQSKVTFKLDSISPNLKSLRQQKRKGSIALKWINYNFKVWEMDTPTAKDPLGLNSVLKKDIPAFERDKQNFKLLSDKLWELENSNSLRTRTNERLEKLMGMNIGRDFEQTLNPQNSKSPMKIEDQSPQQRKTKFLLADKSIAVEH